MTMHMMRTMRGMAMQNGDEKVGNKLVKREKKKGGEIDGKGRDRCPDAAGQGRLHFTHQIGKERARKAGRGFVATVEWEGRSHQTQRGGTHYTVRTPCFFSCQAVPFQLRSLAVQSNLRNLSSISSGLSRNCFLWDAPSVRCDVPKGKRNGRRDLALFLRGMRDPARQPQSNCAPQEAASGRVVTSPTIF